MHLSNDTNKFPNDGNPQQSKGPSEMMLTDDSFFLLYLIMGMYIGPDLEEEVPPKSVLQRRAEGLPPYTADQLRGSRMRMTEVEQIYYNLLKEAPKSVVVKLPTLRRFIEGRLPSQSRDAGVICPQFPDLFPLDLHPHSVSLNRRRLIENIVYIGNPEVFYLNPDDIERFKRLTGLPDFAPAENDAKMELCFFGGELYDVKVDAAPSDGEVPIMKDFHSSLRKRRSYDIPESENSLPRDQAATPVKDIPYNTTPKTYRSTSLPSRLDFRSGAKYGPAMVVLPSDSTLEELDSMLAYAKDAYALTGSAAKGRAGPVIGLMDIGECRDSYLFRVALPGVKREDRAFRCEVESDGKVSIKGETTTGEKEVYRHSQVFEMQTRNLCPPGPFSITFHLPGPVDPQRFSGSFGTDAILEGIVVKASHSKPPTMSFVNTLG
ncbi:hypothetical protein Ancab_024145 [Ancistrocladus abbreviatus]